jgi:HEAT repeat protein
MNELPICPTCEKPIDALSSVARVRNARVVTFCSEQCADRPETVQPEPEPEPTVEVHFAPVAVPPTAREPDLEPEIEVVRAADMVIRPRRGGRRHLIAISAAVLFGGMVIAIIGAVSPSAPSNVDAKEAPAEPVRAAAADVEASTPPEDLPLDPAKLLIAATDQLRELLDSNSPRIQRIAAMALARGGDVEALDRLDTMLENEPSALGRVEISYALARSGRDTGLAVLRRSLGHHRRDVRLDAAGALVKLGDDAGRKQLRHNLGVFTHKISVAELLARIGDEKGIALLQATLKNKRASDENKMRAAVALGRAGHEEVRDQLYAIMKDGRFQVGAADALATLGDESAVDALTEQLGTVSMRVSAALALRRLGAEVELELLADALETANDVGKVSAAEAIMILAGPEQLAERD